MLSYLLLRFRTSSSWKRLIEANVLPTYWLWLLTSVVCFFFSSDSQIIVWLAHNDATTMSFSSKWDTWRGQFTTLCGEMKFCKMIASICHTYRHPQRPGATCRGAEHTLCGSLWLWNSWCSSINQTWVMLFKALKGPNHWVTQFCSCFAALQFFMFSTGGLSYGTTCLYLE